MPGARRWGLVVPLAVGVVVLDHATKWWALQELSGRTIDLVWTLRLRLVFNTGAAFGLGARFAPLIAIAALVVVGILLRNAGVLRSWPSAVGVGLVLGGAVGNLIDRAFRQSDGFLRGAVVDFIDLQWWPVFNVADIAIVVGAALVAFTSALEPAPDDEASPAGGGREAS